MKEIVQAMRDFRIAATQFYDGECFNVFNFICTTRAGLKNVNVHFKRNSLCVQGCVSEDYVTNPKSIVPSLPAVRAVHLERVLRRLLPGWNKISPQVYALTTRRAKFVDTTVCPATEMMWLRTTLVFGNGQGWKFLEFSEPVSEMDDMEGDIYDPESVLECPLRAQRGTWFLDHR